MNSGGSAHGPATRIELWGIGESVDSYVFLVTLLAINEPAIETGTEIV